MSDTRDMTDDWMNPSATSNWTMLPLRTGISHTILRKRSIVVSGPTGSLTRWDQWAEFDTEAARDEELKRLAEQHPMWRLKPGTRNYDLERIGIYPED